MQNILQRCNWRDYSGAKSKLLSLTVLCVLVPQMSFGSAPFCALRDPSHQIYDMYDDATSYRSVVREVDTDTRQRLSADLPFGLHKNELGEHTLYIPLSGDTPLGIVHVRSESSEWGLIEVAWALTPELRVSDFRLQRCRGKSCDSLVEKGFIDVLQGKGQDRLLALLSDSDSEIVARIPNITAAEIAACEHPSAIGH